MDPLSSYLKALRSDYRRESNVMLEGERPVTVEVFETEEVKDFKYNYKCKRCGHEWSEERFKTTERAGNPEYKGD